MPACLSALRTIVRQTRRAVDDVLVASVAFLVLRLALRWLDALRRVMDWRQVITIL